MQTNLLWLMCLISVTMILAEHWFPWRMLLGRDLPRPAAYVLGVLSIMAPISVLFILIPWLSGWRAVVAMWYVVISAGAATILAYLIDVVLQMRVRVENAEREGLVLREVTVNGKTESRD